MSKWDRQFNVGAVHRLGSRAYRSGDAAALPADADAGDVQFLAGRCLARTTQNVARDDLKGEAGGGCGAEKPAAADREMIRLELHEQPLVIFENERKQI